MFLEVLEIDSSRVLRLLNLSESPNKTKKCLYLQESAQRGVITHDWLLEVTHVIIYMEELYVLFFKGHMRLFDQPKCSNLKLHMTVFNLTAYVI